MGYGLLNVRSNAEIEAEEQKRLEQDSDPTPYESELARHIQSTWELNRWAKESIENEMLECLRQRNGEYDRRTLQSIREQGGSEIYMMLTATKIRAAVSWMRDILLPANDKSWGMTPTPIPDLPPFAMKAIAQRIRQTLPEMEPDMGWDQYMAMRAANMRDEMVRAMRSMAKEAAENMERKIEDQLAEGGWEDALGEFIEDFCTFPGAIMKGPVFQKKRTLKWGPGGEMQAGIEITPQYMRVSPFDIYPSPDSTTINDGDFIERVRYTRKSLYNLIGVPGYNDAAIRAALSDYARGGLRDWLWKDYERADLEGKDKYWMKGNSKTIDGLHYWGSAQGLWLLEWGIDPCEIDDPLAEYEIDAIKVGRYIIRAVINRDPLGRRPYHKACYQSVPGGFWGISIPKLMRDHQRMCNATARSLANNLGISSGPMVEIEVDRLADGENPEQIYPWKIFQTKSDKTGRGREAIRFFQPNSNAAELLAVYEQFERRSDDATGIPRYAYGNEKVGGAGNTAAGLSMLMNNASKGIKLAISGIDTNVIRPVIEQTFTYNMLYDPNKSIKGDAKIIARGSTAILVKEQTQMRRAEFMAMTSNPLDMELMGKEGRLELLRAQAELLDMDVDKIIPTREDLAARQEQQQQPPPDPKLIEIEEKGKIEREKMNLDMQKFQQKLELDASMSKEKMDIEIEKHRQKLEMEYQLKMQIIEEEARQKELDREIEREKEMAQRDLEIARIREEIKLNREKSETEEPRESEAAPVINLNIDNKSGAIKKEIVLNRGKDNMLSGATVIEEEQE